MNGEITKKGREREKYRTRNKAKQTKKEEIRNELIDPTFPSPLVHRRFEKKKKKKTYVDTLRTTGFRLTLLNGVTSFFFVSFDIYCERKVRRDEFVDLHYLSQNTSNIIMI